MAKRNSVLRLGQKRGQSILDYAILVAVVAAALVSMSTYIQRSVQANLKMIEDQINAAAEPDTQSEQ